VRSPERACSVSNRGTSYPPSTRGARREEQDPTELDVPEEVIAWIGNWALGLELIDAAGRAVLPGYAGRPVTKEPKAWPALLALRERIPHPLLIDEPERTDFIAAVEQWDRRIDERMFLIERASLAWVERYGEPPHSFARIRSGGRGIRCITRTRSTQPTVSSPSSCASPSVWWTDGAIGCLHY